MPPKSKERKKVARIVPAKAKKREGFQSSSSSSVMARSSGVKPEKKKRQRRECSHPYCESLARKGGLCHKHGVKRICSAEGR